MKRTRWRRLRIESLESRQLLSGTSWPSHVSVPYVDTTLYPAFDLASAAQASGNKYYTLAFIVAGSTSEPAWGGQDSLAVSTGYMSSQINALRAIGGNVVISFGGANGTELAQAVNNTAVLTQAQKLHTLQADYQQVIDAYGVNRLDFDIEGSDVGDHAAMDLRSQALANLQQTDAAAGDPIQIWLTLPVLPSGLTTDGVYAVQSVLSHGVNLGGVNVMAMDFGDSSAPNPSGQMGTYAIDSATSTFNQVKQAYTSAGITISDAALWQKIGITPMIGVNDQQDEVFDQAAANQVLAFAQQNNIGELAFWSATRDFPPPSGQLGQVAATHSGISQTNYQFTEIFASYDLPTLSLNNISVTEGATGTTPATFTVTLSAASAQTVTVNYATLDGTATAGGYYTATSGTLTFAPGVTQQTITVPVIDNPALASGKQFQVVLSNASGATVAGMGTCTIVNPNAPEQISIANVTQLEDAASTGPVVFTLTLARPVKTGETVSVHYTTADGTAKAGVNYAAKSGTLTFAAGASQATVSVPYIGGLLPQSTEQFSLVLSNPVGASLAVAAAAATIEDDDPPVSIVVSYETTDDWGTGFGAQVNIENTGTQAISSWQLAFSFPYKITSFWDGNYTQSGNSVVVTNPTWSGGGTIGAGQTVSFGFNGSPGNVTTQPSNYVFNGVSLSPPAPLIVGGSAWTSAGLTLSLANDGDEHLYTTGTTTDAVAPLLATTVSNVQIQGPTSSANTLTVNFASGNPIPSGGVTYNGGQAGQGNALLVTGTASSQAVTISGNQLTVGNSAAITMANVGFLGINVGSSGIIGLAGSSGLVKTGPGTLILAGTNSVSGGIVVTAGTLDVTSLTAVPSGTNLTMGSAQYFSGIQAATTTAATVSAPLDVTIAASVPTTSTAVSPMVSASADIATLPAFPQAAAGAAATSSPALPPPAASVSSREALDYFAGLATAVAAEYSTASLQNDDSFSLSPLAVDAVLLSRSGQ